MSQTQSKPGRAASRTATLPDPAAALLPISLTLTLIALFYALMPG